MYLGIGRSTVHKWQGSGDARFVDTLEQISLAQENKALNGGLLGDFNSTITKLVLANHGYHEKKVVDANVTNSDLTDEQLNAKLKALINASSGAE